MNRLKNVDLSLKQTNFIIAKPLNWPLLSQPFFIPKKKLNQKNNVQKPKKNFVSALFFPFPVSNFLLAQQQTLVMYNKSQLIQQNLRLFRCCKKKKSYFHFSSSFFFFHFQQVSFFSALFLETKKKNHCLLKTTQIKKKVQNNNNNKKKQKPKYHIK